MTPINVQEHLAREHKQSPFAEYLKEIVYGGIDGIVTTFAVVAGFSGAQLTGNLGTIPLVSVLLFGLANLFADASSMGLGNFLSVRADQDLYTKEKKKELHEIRNSTEFEKLETVEILTQKGYSPPDAKKMTSLLMKNEDYWVDFMMRDELEMSNPHQENPILTGIATFFSFIMFGFIPLAPYVLLVGTTENLFLFSILFTTMALIILGIFRYKVTQQDMIRSILETLLVGSVSALIAYGVGTFFE